jgi:glycosyltransferase involved in cell wall biosynthesis
MRILIYSRPFEPSIGGVETVTAILATNLIGSGHECRVITETPGEKINYQGYSVFRSPGLIARLTHVAWSDIVHSNGASVALYPYAVILGKPFVWTHQGYQVISIDGLGWLGGESAPMTMWASFRFHARRMGIGRGFIGLFKLIIRRRIAQLVDMNIAITEWVARRQPLPKQIVIYNPFPTTVFSSIKPGKPAMDFIFIGRLVSEKGVDILLRAFKELLATPGFEVRTLSIVGDGPLRGELESLAKELQIAEKVHFAGAARGQHLHELVSKATIGIVPSVWEEAMGGVCIELLATGKIVIVSERGGLAELIGDAGLTFRNGDYIDLCRKMKATLAEARWVDFDPEIAKLQARRFDENALTKEYIDAYRWTIWCKKKVVVV